MVTRGRAERVASAVVMIAAIGSSLAGALPLAMSFTFALAVLWLAQPALGCVLGPRRRCRSGDLVRRVVSLLASAAHRIVTWVARTADLMQSVATSVALASADDRLVGATAATTSRLHGLTHTCVLRARLTTSAATDC